MRSPDDLEHALWLMRLSYLRFSLKTATKPHELLEQEGERLRLGPVFKSQLEVFIPKKANPVPA
jgi:hypothetical protein